MNYPIDKSNIQTQSFKFEITDKSELVGRIYLHVIHNATHKEPYGLMADLIVEEKFRGQGFGTKLVQTVIDEAKRIGCYKLLSTVRSSKEQVHAWYEKMGFKNWGTELRMDFR